MKVMVDNDLPPRLARALHILFEDDGDEIVALRDKFGRDNLKDEEWIRALRDDGRWAVLSADQRIAKKRPSRELFIGAGLVGFSSLLRYRKNRFIVRYLVFCISGRACETKYA